MCLLFLSILIIWPQHTRYLFKSIGVESSTFLAQSNFQKGETSSSYSLAEEYFELGSFLSFKSPERDTFKHL